MTKEKTVCFTGHRPEKLPGYKDPDSGILDMIKSMLYYRIYSAAQAGYEYFISGVARGVDLWAAESVLEIKKKFPRIQLICAKPFAAHGSSFRGKDLWTYNNVIDRADEVVCVSDKYSYSCYKARNYYMVDRSSCLIGVVSDYKSGTGQTIAYARKSGLKISLIKTEDIILSSGYVEKNSQIMFD
ncbi:MAG: DUF1273 domain-containing protein [Clostridium sp.]|nr:DUF1273 domain-containing protein [Clostridium sp.]MCM1547873.1 DUF1273 domain-containing protein [Ruminococcus sp.]